jgi:hypothetical protein
MSTSTSKSKSIPENILNNQYIINRITRILRGELTDENAISKTVSNAKKFLE